MIINYNYPMDELVRKEKEIAFHSGKNYAVKIILKKFDDLIDEELKNALLEHFKGIAKELETSKSFMKEDDVEELIPLEE